MAQIDSTARVSPEAALADDVRVGPYAIVGAAVSIGSGTEVGPHVRIEGPTTIGERNRFIGHSSIGTDPQDLKFGKEKTELRIGNDNVFREFITINRGTEGGGAVTSIGSSNFMMAYSHIAHDCHIGDNTIFANGATLAGHVEVGDFSTVGAFAAVHQFCRVGEHAFIGAASICVQDVLPFCKTVGNRDPKTYGINTLGLERKGFPKETIEALQRAYRILIRSKLKLADAIARLDAELSHFPEVRYLADFVRSSKRGFIR